jgi:L-2-hydroxyglutarate oxidase
MESTDFLIVGAGIVGLAVANEIRQRHPKASIVVLEKESDDEY